MSVLTALSPPPPDSVRRFSVDDYHRMIRANILAEDDPVELLEGWILTKMPRNAAHDATIDVVRERVSALLPARWRIRVQSAVTLAGSEPEPELAVVRGPAARYFSHHPFPADIGLLIEVAEASLDRDRRLKAPIYARERIPVYWIINLSDRRIEVFSRPIGQGDQASYAASVLYHSGDDLPLVLGGKSLGELKAADLLPPP